MQTLREYISDAAKNKTAIGHFNFATAEMLRGIAEAAKETGRPVIVGLSEGERESFGVKEGRAVVSAMAEDFGIPIFLNADHTHSFEKAKEAIDAGFDAVVADGSSLSFSENVSMVKKIIAYGKGAGRDVIIEGELGFIGSGSEIWEKLPPGLPIEESKMTSPEEARQFIEETGADLLAPAVGNIHGIVQGGGNPPLSARRAGEIRKAANVPLVLHGASGSAEKDIKEVVRAGAAIVHWSSDLRVAYKKSLLSSLSENIDEISPYKYLRESVKSIKETVKQKIALIS